LSTYRGFTLIEVAITAGILLCGLVAVAYVFSFAVRTNGTNRQMAVATTLLYDKMEEFRSTPFTHAVWLNATGSETLVIAGERYTRAWKIKPGTPRTVTVIIYIQNQALTRRQSELIRATTLVSPTF
jgi:Tfp pilus assembly protein PilV